MENWRVKLTIKEQILVVVKILRRHLPGRFIYAFIICYSADATQLYTKMQKKIQVTKIQEKFNLRMNIADICIFSKN